MDLVYLKLSPINNITGWQSDVKGITQDCFDRGKEILKLPPPRSSSDICAVYQNITREFAGVGWGVNGVCASVLPVKPSEPASCKTAGTITTSKHNLYAVTMETRNEGPPPYTQARMRDKRLLNANQSGIRYSQSIEFPLQLPKACWKPVRSSRYRSGPLGWVVTTQR